MVLAKINLFLKKVLVLLVLLRQLGLAKVKERLPYSCDSTLFSLYIVLNYMYVQPIIHIPETLGFFWMATQILDCLNQVLSHGTRNNSLTLAI